MQAHAGLVSIRREGTHHFYQAQPEGFAELRNFLDGFWETHLSRLKQVAEADEQADKQAERRTEASDPRPS